jgi:hypothetical protein
MSASDDDAFLAAVMEVAMGCVAFGPEVETEKQLQAEMRGYSEAERIVASTWVVYNEIYNGGFWQLYGNSTGMWAPESVDGFQRIGLPEISALVEKSLAVFPDRKTAVSLTQRRKFLKSALEEVRFQHLEREFGKLEARFMPNWVRYARDHADELGVSL